ncbi:hypothetical protein M0R04_09040 [Candidatus Dojkabacteria bacterium]|nr:hypothetical protein [Candidatus Dojkabacteria bacterium]
MMIPTVLSYNLTITPTNYDFKYSGEDKTLTFRICQDSGSEKTIALVTEASADVLNNLAKMRIKSAANIKVTKCSDFPVLLSSSSGYTATFISLRVKAYNTTTYPKINNTISNVDIVKNIVLNNLSNTNVTDNSTITKKPNKTVQMIAVIVIVIGVLIAIGIYFYNRSSSQEQSF